MEWEQQKWHLLWDSIQFELVRDQVRDRVRDRNRDLNRNQVRTGRDTVPRTSSGVSVWVLCGMQLLGYPQNILRRSHLRLRSRHRISLNN